MKLTELILQLHTEMLTRGNVDVWIGGNRARPPKVVWSEKTDDHPAGMYLH
jgi:hypothetical protein